eukprot:3195044-Pyramimonas_sp.AAC.1
MGAHRGACQGDALRNAPLDVHRATCRGGSPRDAPRNVPGNRPGCNAKCRDIDVPRRGPCCAWATLARENTRFAQDVLSTSSC